MIDSAQEAQLTGGGECFIHFHPQEPLNFDDHVDVMESDPVIDVSTNYTLTSVDYHVRVDTTAGNVTVTLPLAANGREYQITKLAAGNLLYIVPTAPDTLIGSATGVIVRNAYTSLHLKAVDEGWQFV